MRNSRAPGVERPSTPLKARWRIVAADTCELRATRQKVKASAICFVLPSRLPLELGGEGSADLPRYSKHPFLGAMLVSGRVYIAKCWGFQKNKSSHVSVFGAATNVHRKSWIPGTTETLEKLCESRAVETACANM